MTREEKDKRQKFLINRIDRLDICIHELEATANNCYTPLSDCSEGWNLLLRSRDKIVKMRDEDWEEYEKLK